MSRSMTPTHTPTITIIVIYTTKRYVNDFNDVRAPYNISFLGPARLTLASGTAMVHFHDRSAGRQLERFALISG